MCAARTLFDEAVAGAALQLREMRGASVYVNGASGFLASNLIALMDLANTSRRLDLKLYASARRPIADVPLFRFLELQPRVDWSIASAESATLPELPGCVVVHTASYGAPADYLREPMATFRANTEGLIRTFAEASRIGAAHVVFLSSAEVYGQPPPESIPTSEDYSGGPDLSDVRSIYGESKRMAEVLGVVLSQETGIPFTAVRPWNLYGPGQRADDGRVPAALMRMALADGVIRLRSDGTPRRCPCFVWDGLLQLTACLDPARAGAGPANIGNPNDELSIAELARRCAEEAGIGADRVELARPGDAQGLVRCTPSIERVEVRALSPLPAMTSLDEGLAALREWLTWSTADA